MKKKFRSFNQARKFVHSLKLKNQKEWRKYLKSGKKPKDIPAYPDAVYSKQWKSVGDWLGTERIANQNRKYRSFEEARKFVQSLGLKNGKEWVEYCKSGKIPNDIPRNPYKIYSKK